MYSDPPIPEHKPTKRHRASVLRTIPLMLISGLLGGLVGGALVFLALNNHQTNETPSIANKAPSPADLNLAVSVDSEVTNVVSEVGPAVVTVINYQPRGISFFGTPINRNSSGSGFIISSQGFIVANYHVIEGFERLEVILSDGTMLPADLIGSDACADLAILQTDGEMPAIAKWGNSDALKSGEPLIAIGSPLGDFTNTVTVGVVSATERSIEIAQDYALEGLIQTDAAINQGNSGGPLLNLAGEVVGINTLIVRGDNQGSVVAEGLGFAIPSNTARAIAEQVIQNGYFARPNLGIRWVTITPGLSARYRLPVQHGIYITDVQTDGLAATAGLAPGDIITKIQGEPIDSDHPFQNQLFQFEPGDRINVEILREGDLLEREIDLGTMPA
jgi:serine protease Do